MVYLAAYEQNHQENKRQQEHILGRKLLDYGLQQEYALFLSETSIREGDCGKPYLPDYPDVHFNISHCEGMVACVLANQSIGVDVERIRPFSVRTARRIMTEEEQKAETELTPKTFFRYWTLKESYVKAIGKGLSYPMKKIRFWWGEDGTIFSNCTGYEFCQTCLEERFWLAICIRSEKEKKKERRNDEI